MRCQCCVHNSTLLTHNGKSVCSHKMWHTLQCVMITTGSRRRQLWRNRPKFVLFFFCITLHILYSLCFHTQVRSCFTLLLQWPSFSRSDSCFILISSNHTVEVSGLQWHVACSPVPNPFLHRFSLSPSNTHRCVMCPWLTRCAHAPAGPEKRSRASSWCLSPPGMCLIFEVTSRLNSLLMSPEIIWIKVSFVSFCNGLGTV